MSETYLDGKIIVTSLAAPTAADLVALRALSEDERNALLREAVERGRRSPTSHLTMDDVWQRALDGAAALKTKRQNAL